MQKVSFHLTGHSMKDVDFSTSSSHLMKTLPVFLNRQKTDYDLPFTVGSCTILDSSVQLARDQIKVLHENALNNLDDVINVYIHCSVDKRTDKFSLQVCALNDSAHEEAERSRSPNTPKLLKKRNSDDSFIKSSLPISWTYECLRAAGWNDFVEYSDLFPSKSFCNSIYFSCLQMSLSAKNHHSVFISCPPFTVFEEEEQLSFICDSLQVITESLLQPNPASPPQEPDVNEREYMKTFQTLINLGWAENLIIEAMRQAETYKMEVVYSFLLKICDNEMQPRNLVVDKKVTTASQLFPHSDYSKSKGWGKKENPIAFDNQNMEWSSILSTCSARSMQTDVVKYESSEPINVTYSDRHSMPPKLSFKPQPSKFCQSPRRRRATKSLTAMYDDRKPKHTDYLVRFGQEYKMLLVIREDLMLSTGDIALQSVQVSSRASQLADEKDPEAVYNWGLDGNKAMIAGALNDIELREVIEGAVESSLHVYSLTDEDTENVPAGLTAIGPAPYGVLLEISEKLSSFSSDRI